MLDSAFIYQVLLFALVLLGAALLFIDRRRIDSRRTVLVLGVVGLVGVVTVTAWSRAVGRRTTSHVDLVRSTPRLDLSEEGFVTSDTCRACHPGQYESWHDSYHRTMTQRAEPGVILGRMEGTTLSSRGRTYRFSRRGDEWWVDMVDPEWEAEALANRVDPNRVPNPPRVTKRVVMTTGSHHMQTYWVGSEEDGQLFNLSFVWLNEDQRWAPREDVFLRPQEFGRMYSKWHTNCIECHATAGEKDVDPVTGSHRPRAAELGIACEACHGPAEAHVRAHRDPRSRYRQRLGGEPDPTIVNPARLPAPASAQVCGQCHGINLFKGRPMREGVRYRAGGDLTETRIFLRGTDRNLSERERADWPIMQRHIANQSPAFMDDRLWPDGMVRVSGREHNAMIESACFQGHELSCLSCHSMHESDPTDQLASNMGSDEACLQCHASYRDRIPEHTHHAPGSSGSACYNCHMPHTTYGLLKGIRSHLIDSPSAASVQATGRPNACTLCHLDRSLQWEADHLTEWWGQPRLELEGDDVEVAAGVLGVLTGDANQRALYAWHMGWEPAVQASGRDWLAPYLGHLLGDPYAAVRYIAGRSLRRLPGFERFAYDFVGPARAREDARQRAVRTWAQHRPTPLDRAGPSVLMDASGTLDAASLDRLARRRNNRAVDLRE